jgi:hypothetical protein
MKLYKGILEDILVKAQKMEPLSSLNFEKYRFKEKDFSSFIAFSLGYFPESIAIELLISLKERLGRFTENDWKNVVRSFSEPEYFANRTLIHFLMFHTDAPLSFIERIGLNTKSISNDFISYYNNAKKKFYGEYNGINRSLYEKLNLNSTDLEMLKKIGALKKE